MAGSERNDVADPVSVTHVPASDLQWNPRPLAHPLRIRGNVVSGFRRGSKLLGIPTANLPYESFKDALGDVDAGVYFGWASVSGSPAYKTVLSIGWNPYFKNSQKTVEPYLLHKFEEDFYGQELKLLICGYIRPEADFSGLEALIAAIQRDIQVGDKELDDSKYQVFRTDEFFSTALPPSNQGKL